MMQEVEVLKTIPELVCSYFSEEQFTLSMEAKRVDLLRCAMGECDKHNCKMLIALEI